MEYNIDNSGIYPLSQMSAFAYGSLAFLICVMIALLLHKKASQKAKKWIYTIITIAVVLPTIYLVLTTIHLNAASATKGPVHWHADFEIWVCGRQIKLAEPKELSNQQGAELIHSHDDSRIHVEGVLMDKKSASLGAFFYSVGGYLSKDSLQVPTDNGVILMHEGDKCYGNPAKIYVFVNGKQIENPADYVISPYEKVPPGDVIKIEFA